MSFAKQIQDKLGEHDPSEVNELILDQLFENVGNFTEDHKSSLEKYKMVDHLSLNEFGLVSLNNFPKLPQLSTLEIRQNNLSGSDLSVLLPLYPNLYKLKLGQNPIDNIKVFDCFKNLPTLRKLEVTETLVGEIPNYKELLFQTLPNLEVIDNLDRQGDEVETTIIDEGDENFGDDESFEDDEFDEGDDDDEEEEESEEEESANKKGKKARNE